jgi:hypothetical protein
MQNSFKSVKTLRVRVDLDMLTDIFSFFDSFDENLSSQVCVWWNDLLTKDVIVTKQTKINTVNKPYYITKLEKVAELGYKNLLSHLLSHLLSPLLSPLLLSSSLINLTPRQKERNKNLFMFGSPNLALLKWFHEINKRAYPFIIFPWNKLVFIRPAQEGNLKILKWLNKLRKTYDCYKDSGVWYECVCSAAIHGNHFDVLKWLRDQAIHGNDGVCPWDEQSCWMAVSKGHIEILRWLRNDLVHGNDGMCPWNEKACTIACRKGNLEVLKFLRNKEDVTEERLICPWDEESCKAAAIKGNLPLLEWLLNTEIHGISEVCTITVKTYQGACYGGHLHILKWLLTHRPLIPDKWCCIRAVQGGHLHVLKWLLNPKEHPDWICPPLDEYLVCKHAALGGHLEILKYALFECRCKWFSKICNFASDHPTLIEYIHSLPEDKFPCWDRTKARLASLKLNESDEED